MEGRVGGASGGGGFRDFGGEAQQAGFGDESERIVKVATGSKR